jgi:hypothetical protein
LAGEDGKAKGILPLSSSQAIAKPVFLVILNGVKDLNPLKMRDSSLYMKIERWGGPPCPPNEAARDGRPTNNC